MNLSIKPILSRLSLTALKRYTLYFDGSDFHGVGDDYPEENSFASRSSKSQTKVIILSRSCYSESRKNFPIKKKSELQQFLDQSNDENIVTLIGPWDGTARSVLFIELRKGVSERLKGAWFIVPETLILSGSVKEGLYQVETPKEEFYFYRKALNGVSLDNKLFNFQSALRGGVIRGLESAKIAFGAVSDLEPVSLSWVEFKVMLSQGLNSVAPQYLLQLMIKSKKKRSDLPVNQIVVVGAVLTFVYLGFTSAYLNWAESSRENQLNAYGSAVTQRLAQQSEYENELSKLNALRQQDLSPTQVLASYDVVAWLHKNNISLNEIRSDFRTLEVRGEAESATSLVRSMGELPQIADIEFTAPVRRGQSGEALSLRIHLDPEWVSAQNNEQDQAQDAANTATAESSETLNAGNSDE